MSRRRVIVVDAGDYDVTPGIGGGVGVRARELAEALAHGHDVHLIARDAVRAARALPVLDDLLCPEDRWDERIENADAVIFFDSPDLDRLVTAINSPALVVSEMTPPVEHLQYDSVIGAEDPRARYDYERRLFTMQLDASDHFLARSEVERATLVASLVTRGRVDPYDFARSELLSHMVSLVPIGFSRGSAERAWRRTTEPVADFLWTGGLWGFYEPVRLVEALHLCRTSGHDFSVAFLHAAPGPDTSPALASLHRAVDALGLTDAVRFVDRALSDEDRGSVLRAGVAAVCVARPGIENDTCVRLRLRDSRLHALPLVADPFGGTASELWRHGGGLVLASAEPAHLAEAMVAQSCAGRSAEGPDPDYEYERTLRDFESWLAAQTKRSAGPTGVGVLA